MALLLDPPRWPAHDTVFSHLVSDASLAELHDFAHSAGLPARAFDHDHYDVPVRRYADLVERGAAEVDARELVRRLLASGLRVRPHERTPKRRQVIEPLRRRWRALMPDADGVGRELLAAWSRPERHYHDVRHLWQCLTALDALGADARPVQLAAWFHDAVYRGRPGEDEEASARLASQRLEGRLPGAEVAEVARLVRLTASHSPAPGDEAGAQLCDADLSILGAVPGRYHVYLRDVRLDYAEVPEPLFRAGRGRVVEGLLELRPLFGTAAGRDRWAAAAERNLRAEASGGAYPFW